MLFTEEQMELIIQKSAPFFDLIRHNHFTELPEGPNEYELLKKWCDEIAAGDHTLFKKRLDWDAIDPNNLFDRHGEHQSKFPAWAEIFSAYTQEVSSLRSEPGFLNSIRLQCKEICGNSPLPFEEVFIPFVYAARKRLSRNSNLYDKLLVKNAQYKLEESLLKSLVNIGAQTLQLEFSVFRTTRTGRSKIIDLSTNSNLLYLQFVTEFYDTKIIDFFLEYPVLPRLLSIRTKHWSDATAELLSRLDVDMIEIQQTFNGQVSFASVIDIDAHLSDYHNSGRAVSILTFENHSKVVYKPRDCQIETAYNNFLEWLNGNGSPVKFKLFSVLNCKDYAWIEFVSSSEAHTEKDLKSYYIKAGGLLFVTYILNAVDLHNENVIQQGGDPIIIDLETILHHDITLHRNNTTRDAVIEKFSNSVLSSGLLPSWHVDQGVMYDRSALGALNQLQERITIWHNINLDGMQYKPDANKRNTSSIKYEQVDFPITGYVEEILAGFTKMYRFFCDNKEVFLTRNGPIAYFKHKVIRYVFRRTQIYSWVLQRAMKPRFMRDGLERSIKLDILSRDLLSSDTKPPTWPIFQQELLSLEDLDIPIFFSTTDDEDLIVSGAKSVKSFFEESCFSRTINKIKSLDEDDLEQQLDIIKASIYSTSNFNIHQDSIKSNQTASYAIPKTYLTQEELVSEAKAIGKTIVKRGISSKNSITWIAHQYVPQDSFYKLQPLGYNFYDGVPGVALFLGALGHITNDEQFKEISISSLNSILKELNGDKIQNDLLGGAMGFTSLLYPIAHISKYAQQSSLLSHAMDIVSLLSKDVIEQDKKYDILSGCAGIILGLLTLYDQYKHTDIIRAANYCGSHLLYSQEHAKKKLKSCSSEDGKIRTGFSHGMAGIAYALLRLYNVTRQTDYLNAAKEAISLEQSLFDPEKGNWPNSNLEKDNVHPCSWCNGAAGIGLGRLAGQNILNTASIQNDIDRALKTTTEIGLTNIDHVCCGNLGRLEFLNAVANRYADSELYRTAQNQISAIVRNAQERGHYNYGDHITFTPTLFKGAAGIGYQLLRFAHPDKVPSLLTWE